jgi:uncharacterized protein (DUF486 family)
MTVLLLGYGSFTGYQLKILQEIVTLCVFVAFARAYLGERPTAVAFAFYRPA